MKLFEQMIALMSVISLGQGAYANDIDNAPAAFDYKGQMVVPVDFQRVDLSIEVDIANDTAIGTARIQFDADQTGYPMFDLVRDISSITLNGTSLAASDAPTISDPDNSTEMRVVKSVVTSGSTNILEVTYDLASEITFYPNFVRAGFWMSDLTIGGRTFFEQYGPTSFEWDHYTQIINLNIIGTSRSHTIYANGEITSPAPNQFNIVYPDYFTTSSFYLHLTEAGRFTERTAVYNGLERNIDVLVYANSPADAKSGLSAALDVLAENEATYGPFAHPKALAYIAGSGGMEYGGATMTSLWALEHEFTHFWFARGVMPANGNAGWIDEAVASWRDNRYPRAGTGPTGSPHNLGGFSQYQRHTSRLAYTSGAGFISELDKMFESQDYEGQSGMRGILRKLFQERQRQSITVQYFKEFLETVTGTDLTDEFDKYVYGQGKGASTERQEFEAGFEIHPNDIPLSRHPRPYTKAELIKYR